MKKNILLLCCSIIAASLLLPLSGCAHGVVKDGKGKVLFTIDAHGAFKDVTFLRKENPDGSVIYYYSSRSTSADIMNEINKFTGTAVGVARDIIP